MAEQKVASELPPRSVLSVDKLTEIAKDESFLKEYKPRWRGSTLRTRNPDKAIRFYCDNFDMRLLNAYHFPEKGYSSYILYIPTTKDAPLLFQGTKEADAAYKCSDNYVYLQLTHVHGSEKLVDNPIDNGNVSPKRSFGHIAVSVSDVYAKCESLESDGVGFKKKPDEGRMKGLAFALDTDGYWIEVVRRQKNLIHHADKVPDQRCNLSQTMIRIKDPKISVPFYRDLFGMKCVSQLHDEPNKFSLYFMCQYIPEHLQEAYEKLDPTKMNKEFLGQLYLPILELTHNHGTEDDEGFSYFHSKTGFSNLSFGCINLDGFSDKLKSIGVQFKPNDGGHGDYSGFCKKSQTIYDPDGYSIVLFDWFVRSF